MTATLLAAENPSGDDYMIVDLQTGEVTYEGLLGTGADGQTRSNARYNTDEYKTTKMVLRKVPRWADRASLPNGASLPENGYPTGYKGTTDTDGIHSKYPNSPTGQVGTPAFFDKVVRFAHKNDVVVVQDAAHAMFSFGQRPMSFLEVDGAKEVGIEIHSMSKGWNMIGWRLGWFCGNALIVRALADVKDNNDSGQFLAIQKAAVKALDEDRIPDEARAKYHRRLQKLVASLNKFGFDCKVPGGTYFLYTRSPKGLKSGRRFENAEQVSQFLITEQSVCTVPWDDAGSFLRWSVTYLVDGEAGEDALMNELEERLAKINFGF